MSWILLIWSFVLMLFPKWATEERGKQGLHHTAPVALGSFAFPGVPHVPSTQKERSTCCHSELPRPLALCRKGPRVPPPALPFRAQSPARQDQNAAHWHFPRSPGPCWGFFSTLSLCPIMPWGKPKENGCSLLHWASPCEKEKEAKDLEQDFRKKSFFFSFSVYEIYNVFQRELPTQSLPAGK